MKAKYKVGDRVKFDVNLDMAKEMEKLLQANAPRLDLDRCVQDWLHCIDFDLQVLQAKDGQEYPVPMYALGFQQEGKLYALRYMYWEHWLTLVKRSNEVVLESE